MSMSCASRLSTMARPTVLGIALSPGVFLRTSINRTSRRSRNNSPRRHGEHGRFQGTAAPCPPCLRGESFGAARRGTHKRKRPVGVPPAVFCSRRAGETGAVGKRSATRENASQLADRFLMLLVLDFGEIARNFEQHPLMRRHRSRRFVAEAFVEIGDRRIEHTRDLVKPAGGNAVDAALVFVRLL